MVFETLYRVFVLGLSKEDAVLLDTQSKNVHGRFLNQYGTLGLLAMLVKTITMAFVAMLGEFRMYFEIHDDKVHVTTGHAGGISTEPKAWPHHGASFLGFLAGKPHQTVPAGEEPWGVRPVVWEYYAYVGLLMFSTLFIFVSMMTSVGNYLALSLIDDRGLKHYLERVGFLANLPFLSLIWGVTMWHIALIILMFYIVDFSFGVVFAVGCGISIIVVVVSIAQMLDAVDSALMKVAEECGVTAAALEKRRPAAAEKKSQYGTYETEKRLVTGRW